MIFFAESVALCVLFTAMVRLAMWKRQTAFANDYPPVVTDRLRAMGLLAQRPPARKADLARKAAAMVVFSLLFALLLRQANGIDAFMPGVLTSYALWLVVDWYDFAVVDVLLAPLDRFYRASGVSAFDPQAVRFHFMHSLLGMALGIPFALMTGLLILLI
ncbi:MAG: hypothetical protein J6K32_07180 [Clostridia bacterium]|nr:hypothetical protein [Clostridia bacterium]